MSKKMPDKPSIFNESASEESLKELRSKAKKAWMQSWPWEVKKKILLDDYIQALDKKINPDAAGNDFSSTFRMAAAPNLAANHLWRKVSFKFADPKDIEIAMNEQYKAAEKIVHSLD